MPDTSLSPLPPDVADLLERVAEAACRHSGFNGRYPDCAHTHPAQYPVGWCVPCRARHLLDLYPSPVPPDTTKEIS